LTLYLQYNLFFSVSKEKFVDPFDAYLFIGLRDSHTYKEACCCPFYIEGFYEHPDCNTCS
jgi:hypothetical protein